MSLARRKAGDLARESIAAGDPVGWFDRLYAQAEGDPGHISWADLAPNPKLMAWLDRERVEGNGRRALEIGCGLGDDAEELSRRGFLVTAFDVSPTAIDWCLRRFPTTTARYVAPGGELLVIARGREASDPPGTMPWPLLRSELDAFTAAGVHETSFEDFLDAETPPVRRFRAHYRRI